MTRRTFLTLQAQLARLLGRKMTFREAARRAGVVNARGEPDPGMAYKIVRYDQEPTDAATRDRLGLKRICPSCHRPIGDPDHKRHQPERHLTPAERWWAQWSPSMKKEFIEWLYQHRGSVLPK